MNFVDSLKKSLGIDDKESLHSPIEDTINENSFIDEDVITPMQSFYEILLFRPKILDDVDYITDQIVQEQNPVIVDIAYIEEFEGEQAVEKIGDTLRFLKEEHETEVILLCKNEEKHMFLISPARVKILKKEWYYKKE